MGLCLSRVESVVKSVVVSSRVGKRLSAHFLIRAGFINAIGTAQVICRCSGYWIDDEDENVDSKHVPALVAVEVDERFGREEVDEQISRLLKERAFSQLSDACL
jgi:hypothetical protein